jgi:IS30 family transposase
LNSGKSKREIARLIGCSHTTIICEIERNPGEGGVTYEGGELAEKQAVRRRHQASSAPKKMNPYLVGIISSMLLENQSSPVQIAGRVLKEFNSKISHETIYALILKDEKNKGELWKNLRHKRKKYNKRLGKNAGRGLISNRRDISERSAEVEKKERFGDFELDTIVGADHKGAIVSAVDRASKYVLLRLVQRSTAENVELALNNSLRPFSEKKLIHTLTSDNGKEFASHENIAKQTGGSFYFARPYHRWPRPC